MQLLLPTIVAQLDLVGSVLGVVAAVVISFVTIALVFSYFRFQNIVQQAKNMDLKEMEGTPEEILSMQIARYLSGCARRRTSFSLSLMHVGCPGIQIRMGSPVVDAVKQAIRLDDVICVYDDQTAVLLTECEPEDSNSILGRIIGQVAQVCSGIEENDIRVGVSSYPGHGLSGKKLIRVALEGLEQTSVETPILMPEIIDVNEDDEVVESRVQALQGLDESSATGWKERRKNSMLDELTGVLKPSVISAYMQRLMSEFYRKKQHSALFCIGLNKMDHIARFHGEDAADDVMSGVSKILQDNLRVDDLIGRHEKYAFLVLAQCSTKEAEIIGKRISTLVQCAEFVSDTKKLKTTITLGVATYPEHGRNLQHLYTAGQKVLDHSRANDIRAYAVYDPEIHDKVPSKPMRNIKSVKA
ncbi:MAG: diguanylate cyclase [Kiritimatiellaceae bacterium]|nr:diguanylate cyclase [Kiritimatiellaceae bacterium]